MSTEILHDKSAREKLLSGVKKLTDAVKITLGPMGKLVAICKDGEVPHLTKDGVTVANSIYFDDEFENAGALLVKEAAQRSAAVAGDGTTTSTILANEILQRGNNLIDSGHKQIEIIEGMKSAATAVINELKKTKVDITQDKLVDVATISANNDKILGALISRAISKVGKDGAVSVQEAKGYHTTMTTVDGTYIDKGFESPYFVTDTAKQIVELDSTNILVVNDVLSSLQFILPALEKVSRDGTSLLIIANDVTGEAMQGLVLNRIKGGLKVCVVKSPEFANARHITLNDIATLTGATVISDTTAHLKGTDFTDCLGFAKKATITNKTTLLFGTDGGDKNKKIIELRESARNLLDDPTSSLDDKRFAERRIRRLSDGIAVIQVGGATEAEMRERRDRVDDALHATRAALKNGVQSGGGVALVRAAKNCVKQFKTMSTQDCAAREFLTALEEPMRQIVENCGQSPDIILQKIKKSKKQNHGYDGKSNVFGDMFDLCILDPHDVVISSVEHSLSVACNLLSIGVIITKDHNATNEATTYYDNV